jgi:hypothetical protein
LYFFQILQLVLTLRVVSGGSDTSSSIDVSLFKIDINISMRCFVVVTWGGLLLVSVSGSYLDCLDDNLSRVSCFVISMLVDVILMVVVNMLFSIFVIMMMMIVSMVVSMIVVVSVSVVMSVVMSVVTLSSSVLLVVVMVMFMGVGFSMFLLFNSSVKGFFHSCIHLIMLNNVSMTSFVVLLFVVVMSFMVLTVNDCFINVSMSLMDMVFLSMCVVMMMCMSGCIFVMGACFFICVLNGRVHSTLNLVVELLSYLLGLLVCFFLV